LIIDIPAAGALSGATQLPCALAPTAMRAIEIRVKIFFIRFVFKV